jgi:hypothetical protein
MGRKKGNGGKGGLMKERKNILIHWKKDGKFK